MIDPEKLWTLSTSEIAALGDDELEKALDLAREKLHDYDLKIEEWLAARVIRKQILDFLILEIEERRRHRDELVVGAN